MAPRRAKGKAKRETPEERLLRKWSGFATDGADAPSLSSSEREKFFQAAHELVDLDDGIRQSVIHTLASNLGLRRVAQLATETDLTDEVIQSAIIPFLNVIGHPKVLNSGLLEPYLALVYEAFAGKDGECAAQLFGALSTVAAGSLPLNDVEVALAVLARLLDSAAPWSIESFTVVVHALGTALESVNDGGDDRLMLKARKSLESCRNSLDIHAKALPDTEQTLTAFRELDIDSFSKTGSDGPGNLSSKGSRHDNDSSDIRQIQIFPTFGEIMSGRAPYLPVLDPSKLHLKGIDGLLDRHFRLYREDAIGEVRDAIRDEFNQDRHPLMRRKADRNARMHVYRGLQVRQLRCDRFEGLVLTVSIEQPLEIRPLYPKQRFDWWISKNRLQPNSLVCLLDQAGVKVIFCTVVEIRQRPFDEKDGKSKSALPWQDLGGDSRQAIVSVAPVDKKDTTVIADLFSGNNTGRKMFLLEFPEILIQSFQPTLVAIQDTIGKNKLPFADLLAPTDADADKPSTTVTVEAPTYCQQKDFKFDLNCLISDSKGLSLSPSQPFDMQKLIDGSTLDDKQAEALVQALTRRLALCQGPPGTGKSFTSVALLRILLNTEALADMGPILIVTYTNHALDQTLENCLDKGIRNVVRIGSRSKSERLEDLNIRNVSARMERTPLEKSDSQNQENAVKAATALVHDSIASLPASKQQFLDALKVFWKTKAMFDAARKEVDIRCLAESNIIGMTTSGLARNLDMLKLVGVKVVLVEEAGEVLEAHTLTALLPSVEHAILIGDHLQLKPSVNKYDLTSESQHGKPYSLDMSMFERLVNPPKGMPGVKLPCSTLETQRRMQPAISTLVRQTLYPNLKDDASVRSYPNVSGMKDSVFWLDHSFPEAGSGAGTTSKSNDFEVRLIVSLVAHLMAQGVYEPKDIAVITPYLGQLFKLRRSLSEVFEVALDDRDKALLERAGMLDSQSCADNTRKRVEKTSLLQALKVATVDNFQGEEAKVVIISLVRSNRENNCGFLKSPNRINVLLSRAQHGMYLIGNSRTSSGVPMWAQVLKLLREQGNIGTTLRLGCSRHPKAVMEASQPEDFARLSPEGGCNMPCGTPLRCGHACEQICHSKLRHDTVFCREPCDRTREGCSHACQNFCGDPCDARCEEFLKGFNLTLPCGHVRADVRCWETQASGTIKCTVPVSKKSLKCGHTIQVMCSEDVGEDFYACGAPCEGKLECGHLCKTLCYLCPDWGDMRMHAPCIICEH
ncbi:P-loop containing nucleoside triphosphate hydrolase protein [Byssothecium circinans]|uniref:P-loop containing nucleoside triphosphate hydrolase protein n=1 Tax=Byssothecium circinans TaxID=147558 RepID=A0A6A5TLZ5_9PLEO|nr:P-loop containing nucleoside triphosphate hydrolase protein [Byssothecium circinans]